MAEKNWMENTNLWKGFAAVFFIVAAFMTLYSLGYLGPANVVYADSNGLAGAPPASSGGLGFNLNPQTTTIKVVTVNSQTTATPLAIPSDAKLVASGASYRIYETSGGSGGASLDKMQVIYEWCRCVSGEKGGCQVGTGPNCVNNGCSGACEYGAAIVDR